MRQLNLAESLLSEPHGLSLNVDRKDVRERR